MSDETSLVDSILSFYVHHSFIIDLKLTQSVASTVV